MRTATGDTVKVNAEISKESDQVVRDYQTAKATRFDEKVSKIDACSDILELGIETAKIQIDTWNKESQEIEEKIKELKNQK